MSVQTSTLQVCFNLLAFENVHEKTIVECEDGWIKFGDSCYKNLGRGDEYKMAKDKCAEEEATLAFFDSLEEKQWINHMIGSFSMYVGFKGFDKENDLIINMDNSMIPGFRGFTRKTLIKALANKSSKLNFR